VSGPLLGFRQPFGGSAPVGPLPEDGGVAFTVRLEGDALTIATRPGETLTAAMHADTPVRAIIPANLADIKSGSFVGITAVPGPNSSLMALEVHVFPEAMRGTGEGHYPWDLQPESTMTNGTVASVAEAPTGRTLKVTYKGSDQPVEITVPPDAPIVTFTSGSLDLVKPGAHIFTGATKAADGSLSTARVLVGVNGVTPPM